MAETTVKRLFYSATEIAALTGFSVHTIRRAMREGRIPTVQLGMRGLRVRAADIERLAQPEER
jgi:excisionase family DNA binding protein